MSKPNDNKKIIYNQPELELVKSTSNKINPAKVIIIYDLLGNVINPGIQLSDDLNIYRTLIVKNDYYNFPLVLTTEPIWQYFFKTNIY